jgi:transposase InsO family protein
VRVALEEPTVVHTASDQAPLSTLYKITATLQFRWDDGTQWTLPDATVLVVRGLSDEELLVGRPVILAMPAGMPQRIWQRAGLVLADQCEPLPDLAHRAAMAAAATGSDAGAELDPCPSADVVEGNDPVAVHAALDAAVLRAAPVLGPAATERLRAAVHGEFLDVFRLAMCGDPPVRVDPVRVEFEPGATPPRQPPRRRSAQENQFVRDTMARLERFGMVRRTLSATTASPCYAVRKPGADPTAPLDKQYRLVCDLRAVNKISKAVALPLPRLEEVTGFLSRFRFHGSGDCLDGYFQVPLHEDSQAMFTMVTSDGCFTPTRLPQGGVNGTGPFHGILVSVLGDLVWRACVVYVDDVAVVGSTAEELVDNWVLVLRALHAVGFKLRADKMQFAPARMRFCGRVFTSSGVEYDPDFLHSIIAMPRPATAAELTTYIHTVNWMRDCIPKFSTVVGPLQKLLTDCLRSAGVSTKSARQRLLLADHGWGAEHDAAFATLNSLVAAATALSFPVPGHTLCVWTDASDLYFSAVVTQCAPDQLLLPVRDQVHAPVLFISGAFKGAQLRYATIDKEAFALVYVFQRAAHLLRRPGPVVVFTDHANLRYLFSGDVSVAATHKQAADRLERYACFLRGFSFEIRHVAGLDNFVSDALTRWAAPPQEVDGAVALARAALRRSPRVASSVAAECAVGGACGCGSTTGVCLRAPVVRDGVAAGAGGPGGVAVPAAPSPVPALLDVADDAPAASDASAGSVSSPSFTHSDQFLFSVDDCPSQEVIVAAQREDARLGVLPAAGTRADASGVIVSTTGQLYVPDRQYLRLRLLIVAHQGRACHRGVQVTLGHLRQHFFWEDMGLDCSTFVAGCLTCIRVRGGGTVPRPLGHGMQATRPNSVLGCDYLYVRAATPGSGHDFVYLLVLVDLYARYVDLVPCAEANAANVVRALLRWFAQFGVCTQWQTDGGSHFVNSVLSQLRGLLKCDHHITTPYAPWANGAVERQNAQVLTALRALCAEACIEESAWPDLVPLVQANINHSASSALGGYAPVTVMTGLPATNPLSVVFLPDACDFVDVSPSMEAVRVHVESAHTAMVARYQHVAGVHERLRRPRPGEVPVDFGVGDYVVVVRQRDANKRDKLRPVFSGPCRVVDTKSDWVFIVEDLVTLQRHELHASHIRRFADSLLHISPQLTAWAAHSGRGYVIAAITGHRLVPLPPALHVQWDGFPVEDSTWEPLSSLLQDAPATVREYVRTVQDATERAQLLRLCDGRRARR